MSNSDWFDDFMDMKLSGVIDNSDEESTPTQNGGCLPVIIGMLVLGLLLKLLG